MSFSFDGEPRLELRRCDVCGADHESTVGLVLRDGVRYSASWVAWYPHDSEAWVDVILGSWREPNYPDNVTFGCRIEHVDGQDEPACSLVRGADIRTDDPIFGHKLDRDEALAHPWLPAFWEIVDWLIVNDPPLHEHVFSA